MDRSGNPNALPVSSPECGLWWYRVVCKEVVGVRAEGRGAARVGRGKRHRDAGDQLDTLDHGEEERGNCGSAEGALVLRGARPPCVRPGLSSPRCCFEVSRAIL